MKIAIVGNCQMGTVGDILKAVMPKAQVLRLTVAEAKGGEKIKEVRKADLVVHHNIQAVKAYMDEVATKALAIELPMITFRGYSPDCIYVSDFSINSPITYHSLIVLSAFWSELTEAQCVELFQLPVYRYLGYEREFQLAIAKLKSQLDVGGIDPSLIDSWVNRGRFMYTTNHPKSFVVESILKFKLDEFGIPYRKVNVSACIADNLMQNAVYPDLIRGSSLPLDTDEIYFKSVQSEFFSLEEFITKCYKIYKGIPRKQRKERLWHVKFDELGIENISSFYRGLVKEEPKPKLLSRLFGDTSVKQDSSTTSDKLKNPYVGLDDYRFWRRSISNCEPSQVDPVVNFGLKIGLSDKVATAGSCFAQHIANYLKRSGYNYYRTENTTDFPAETCFSASADAFSAHYGNIYTVRQLVQLFDSAFGAFEPEMSTWELENNRFTDPYRPRVFEGGLKTKEKVESLRQQHLNSVRKMFEEMDIFVFTLGLTEGWEVVSDGAALPLAPGVAGGSYEPDKYRFVNYNAKSVESDLKLFINKLRMVNDRVKMILTVSPVSLMATYENQHVLVSTTLSKSILRVAADAAAKECHGVYYFPSYEIITGNFNRGAYFHEDLREVTPEGVSHVMKLFMKHCTSSGDTESAREVLDDGLDEIVCDEELNDPNAR